MSHKGRSTERIIKKERRKNGLGIKNFQAAFKKIMVRKLLQTHAWYIAQTLLFSGTF